MLEEFGGYLKERDGEEFIPVNIEAYQQGGDFT